MLADRATPEGGKAQTYASGRLASTVVAGFWIDVGWLWRDELPRTLACVGEILGRPAP